MPQNDSPRPRRLHGTFTAQPRAAFVELGVTSAFSFLRGASQADELAATANLLGYDALGIADLNSLAGVVRMHVAARTAQLRPVIGARIVLADGTAFLAYPTDRAAYGRLSALITKGRRHDLDGNWQKKGVCDLSLDDLAVQAEGLQLIWLPGEDLSALAPLATRLPGLRHVAATWFYRGDDVARINRLDRAARDLGLSILATNDVRYHVPARRPLQDVMTCIRESVTIDAAGFRLAPNAERHLKSPAEMARLFARWPHAIMAARTVADACRFSLADLRYEYPRQTAPPGRDPQDYLEELTWTGALDRYPGGVPAKVRATLEKELRVIAGKDIARYFLTIRDIVVFARGRGILCQGRGSAANSAVCYVLGITPVDPARFELLFERFINAKREEPPDIDVDFEHERREEVIQHLYDRYGREHAALCATVIHYRPKSAIREVGKAMGLSEDVTARLAGTVWGVWGDGLEHARDTGLDLTDRRLAMTIRLAEELIGMPRHLSQHVGGFVLTEGPLTETVPVGNGAMADRSFIEWDKDDIDALGILKVDVLALGMLTCIRKCLDLISAHHGRRLTLATIPPEDPGVYDMLCRGDSVGVFQVESRAQMNMLPRLKPREFYDLVIEVAIVRPGPIQGDMVHPFLRRREGREAEEYPSPGPPHDPDELKNILKRTLGVPIFQEQAMKIAMAAAEFTETEADALRKAMATFRSRGTIDRLQDRMIGRMIERGYDETFARRCFDQIKGFGEYGFPESHAISFAHLVYVSAWLKHHYPDAMTAALLNSQPMGFYAPAQLVRDARDHGVEVRPADVNLSDWDCTLEPESAVSPLPVGSSGGMGEPKTGTRFALRLGLRQIDGIGEDVARRIVTARDTPFAGVADLHARAGLDARSLRRLAAGDAFRFCGQDRRAAIWAAGTLVDAPDLPLPVSEPPDPVLALPKMPLSEEVVADYQTLRLSLKAHPMAFLRRSMAAQGYASAADLRRMRHGQRAQFAGLVLIRQRPGSAKGVCFVTLEDETGHVNVVIWPKVFEQFRGVIMTARLMEVHGEVQRNEIVLHLVASRLIDHSEALSRLSGTPLKPPLSRADEATRPVPPGRHGHPRNVRIVPRSRDFH